MVNWLDIHLFCCYLLLLLFDRAVTYFIFFWGDSNFCSINLSFFSIHAQNTQYGMRQLTSRHIAVVSAIASEEHSIAIAIDGSVYAWGRGKYGKLGISDFETPDKEKNEMNPQNVLLYQREGDDPIKLDLGGYTKSNVDAVLQLEDRRRVVSLSNHCLALNNKGEVYSWGNAGQGRLGVDFSEIVPFAVPLGMRAHSAMSGKSTVVATEEIARRRGKKSKSGGGESKQDDSKISLEAAGINQADGLIGGGRDINMMVQYSGSEIDIAIEMFRRDRINPSAAFVYQALKNEPVSCRVESINMVSKTTASMRMQIEEEMANLIPLEHEIESIETEIEIMLKSSISMKMPQGIAPSQLAGTTPKITADIVLQHNIFTKILEILLANPNYLILMHKYYTSNTSEVRTLWERDASSLRPTFRRRFAEMIISIYGNMQRPHNEHLFLVCTRSIMLEELINNSYTNDMSQVAANFISGESVFGELVRSYFSLDTNFIDVENRYNELMKEMVAKTDSQEFNFEYDPVQVYYEIRKAQGKASTADINILNFNDAQREDLYNSLPNVKNTVTNRISQLCEVTSLWIDATKQSVKGISSGVRWVCRELLQELERMHGRGKGAEFVVSSFLFDMYFRPVLINPRKIGWRSAGRRRRMPKRLVKNLNEVAILIKRSLTFAKHNSRIRWMVEANGLIERSQTGSLQWIREVANVNMDLPQKMIIDVYKEYLRFGPSIHTLRLPDIHLLRWILLRFEKVQVKPDDPMQPYVVGPFGLFPPGDEVAIQLAENFARVPETVSGLGINFELNTRFYEKMERKMIKIDPFTEVPLPSYLATDECIKMQDIVIESGLDAKKKSFQDWLTSMSHSSDFYIPTTENGQSDISVVRDEIAKNKDEKQKQKKYEDMEMLDNADKLLQQLLQEHTPLTVVMGEIMEQIAFRANIAQKQKRELDAFYGLRSNIALYRQSLEQRRTDRMNYKDSLLWAHGQEPGNGTVAKSAAIKANETLHGGKIVASMHDQPSDLKKRLARSKDVRGCHSEYSLNYLKANSVITDFTVDPTANVTTNELQQIEKSLRYLVRFLPVSFFCAFVLSSFFCFIMLFRFSFP